MDQIEILNPVFYGAKSVHRLAKPLPDLHGKRIGLWSSTGWPNFAIYLDRLAELIQATYGPAALVRAEGPDAYRGKPGKRTDAELIHDFVANIDCAVIGVAA